MTEDNITDETKTAMEEGRNRRSTRMWILLIAMLSLGPVYMAVMQGVRAHVTHLIQRNQGKPLPSFELATTAGDTVRSGDLKGKTVVLHFFRSHCPSCFAEAPSFNRFASAADPDKVAVFSVLLDRVQGYEESVTENTLARMNLNHPVLVADASFVDAFHTAGWSHVTPVTYIADADGTIRHTLRGSRSAEAFSRLIED